LVPAVPTTTEPRPRANRASGRGTAVVPDYPFVFRSIRVPVSPDETITSSRGPPSLFLYLPFLSALSSLNNLYYLPLPPFPILAPSYSTFPFPQPLIIPSSHTRLTPPNGGYGWPPQHSTASSSGHINKRLPTSSPCEGTSSGMVETARTRNTSKAKNGSSALGRVSMSRVGPSGCVAVLLVARFAVAAARSFNPAGLIF
jgi:hypothetical protein